MASDEQKEQPQSQEKPVETPQEQSAEIINPQEERVPVLPVAEQPPTLEPIPEPVAVPKPEFAGIETPCPECGKTGWKNEQALTAHIRFAHELKRRKQQPPKPQVNKSREQANGEPLPPPDFSDIDGGSRPLPPQQAADPGIRYETMAAMSFDMTTGVLARIFGPEWNPNSADERAAMVLAIKRYYESVQLPDIPPGYMLCFVCLAYAAPRLGQQPTRTKLQAAWIWLKLKFTRNRATSPVSRTLPAR